MVAARGLDRVVIGYALDFRRDIGATAEEKERKQARQIAALRLEKTAGEGVKVSVSPDGQQLGFPEIARYRITRGDRAGDRQAYPPRILQHSSEIYRTEVRDLAAYDRMARAGFWDSPEHTGQRAEFVDRRRTS